MNEWRAHGWWKQANISAGVAGDGYDSAEAYHRRVAVMATPGRGSFLARAGKQIADAVANARKSLAQARQQQRQMRRSARRGG